jgi:protein gp37
MSKIEWTNKTWNPIVGCSKVSAGCKNCYAISMAWRLQHIHHSAKKYAGTVDKTAGGQRNWTSAISIPNIANLAYSDPHGLLEPLSWKKPAMVFVNSMSDLFHDAVPLDILDCIFAIMVLTPKHTYQVLTKRPARMGEYFSAGKEALVQRWEDATYSMGLCDKDDDPDAPACLVHNLCEDSWPEKNIWLGVSVENQQTANERIPLLLQVPAAVRFLSCEPLLGPVDLTTIETKDESLDLINKYGRAVGGACGDLAHGIDWIIVGGESGKDARPMHPIWAQSLRDQCQYAGISYFFKQWGVWKPFVDGDSRKPDYGTFKNNPGDWNDSPVGTFLPDVLGLDWGTVMTKVGKKAAGRLLDGREWNEFPGNKPVVNANDDPDLYCGGFD